MNPIAITGHSLEKQLEQPARGRHVPVAGAGRLAIVVGALQLLQPLLAGVHAIHVGALQTGRRLQEVDAVAHDQRQIDLIVAARSLDGQAERDAENRLRIAELEQLGVVWLMWTGAGAERMIGATANDADDAGENRVL